MKFFLAIITLTTLASAVATEILADSQLGQHILSHARQLGNNNNNNNNNNKNNNKNQQFEATWVSGYSIKFQGCHSIKQWNANAEAENNNQDVKLLTQRLVRFRLCPTGSCSASKVSGCSSSYGDYIMDMDTFMPAYYSGKAKMIESKCETYLATCGCSNDDQNGESKCEYDCFKKANMNECIEYNPYEQDKADERVEWENYMTCGELKLNNNNGNNNNGNNNNNVKYYVGPFCSQQGGSVFLGLFTDDTCTEFADVSFESLTGFALPYNNATLIDKECLSCLQSENNEQQQDQQQNANANANTVMETCQTMYTYSGKCEAKMSSSVVSSPNNNSCTYLEGIRIVKADGIIDTGSTRPSAVGNAFIVIFAMAFAAMAFYVWYLRTRLGLKQNSIL